MHRPVVRKGVVTRKRAQVALVLVAVLTAAAGVTVNRVGGSGWQQAVVFTVACAFLIGAGAVARWGGGRPMPRLWTSDAQGRARQLGDVGLGELGVHWSRAADGYGPYVERDVDRELDEAISGGQALVALAGATLAGRTRTLAKAAQRHLPGSWLAWFEEMPGSRLTDLMAEARRQSRGGPVVLWLENADLALVSQFSAGMLGELPPGFRIFMTLDGDLLDSSVLPGEAAEVLNAPGACTRLWLITPAERGRLAAEPRYAEIAAAHEDEPVLMGRLMVSLDRVTDALQTADDDAICRVAVLHAAVDWQRAAVPKPLTREVIERLYRGGYWQQQADQGPGAAASRSGFQRAITQLMAPASGNGPRLLDEVYSGRVTHLRPHPLLPVVADSTEQPPGWAIAERLWNYLIKVLNGSQRRAVGLSACSRGDYRNARQLLDSPDVAAIPAGIMLAIAVSLREAGDVTAARRWYAKAAATSDAAAAAEAMVALGHLETQQGNKKQARRWWEQAIGTEHPDAAPRAMVNLGLLEQELGNDDDARRWWEQAAKTGHPEAAPRALANLGALERNLGHYEDARRWLAKAIGTKHPDMAPMAMVNLAAVEQELGNDEDARRWWEQAASTGHRDAAPEAMFFLGRMEEDHGKMLEARRRFAEATETGHREWAPVAAYSLGRLEEQLGNVAEARRRYLEAVGIGHPDAAPKAMVHLGRLEFWAMAFGEARRWLGKAMATGHPEATARAKAGMGVLESHDGNPPEARRWYGEAIGSGDSGAAANAMINLGRLEAYQGNLAEARRWWQQVAGTGQAPWVQEAEQLLRRMDQREDEQRRADHFGQYGWQAYADKDLMAPGAQGSSGQDEDPPQDGESEPS
jgi:TolA-binding protein